MFSVVVPKFIQNALPHLLVVGLASVSPLGLSFALDWDTTGRDFPLFLGLVFQAYLGFSAFAFVQSYETENQKWISAGYVVFWFSLGMCYLVGKSIWLPIFLEVATFSTILIYSSTGFKDEQIESLSALLLASGISALFLGAWVFLPDNEGIYFLTLAPLIKSGFSGFHFWLPKVNEGGPSHALGAFAGALEIFPLLLFLRYVVPELEDKLVYQLIFPLASLGIFFGGITAFFHKDPKSLLAYSSIESINFLWLCISIYGMFGGESNSDLVFLSNSFYILFYLTLAHHSLSKTFQLFSIGMVVRLSKLKFLDEMKGIGRSLNISPFLMGIATFSYSVLPGTIGFVSEATYLYLNAKILDMPLGRSVFLLPAMIFIFFGIVTGGFAHIRLFTSLFLSTPSPNLKMEYVSEERKMWIVLSFGSLGFWIVILPVALPWVLKISAIAPYVEPDFLNWLLSVSLISFLTLIFVTSLVAFRWFHQVKYRKFWDCGSNYVGPELSIPASVFSEPLRNSLGRYFLTKDGNSILDQSILNLFQKILDFGGILVKSTKNQEEDISFYLMVSSLALMLLLASIYFVSLGWFVS